MTGPAQDEAVRRFDRIWDGWGDRSPKEARIAQHRTDRERFLRALEQVVGRIPVGRILEVGCGSAIDLCLLAQRAPRLTVAGLDISRAGLEVARTFARHLGVHAHLCCGDVFTLPFRMGSIGLVFSQDVLEHFRNPAGAVREQVRILGAGGYLAINLPHAFTGYTLRKHRAIRRGT